MSFQQALSGLNTASQNLDVIGNNISNANTVGFKEGSSHFADIFASTVGGGSMVGLGSQITGVNQQFFQGAINATDNPLDVAISGNGFFRMDNSGVISYSRDGQFHLDKDNYIVNSTGLKLTGFPANANGAINGATPSDLQVPQSNLSPQATSKMSVGVNLDSRSSTLSAAAFNISTPGTYTNTTSATLYDSLGNSHIFSLYYVKTAANSYNVYGSMDNTEMTTAPTVTGKTAVQANAAYDFTINGQTFGPGTTAATSPGAALATAINTAFTAAAGAGGTPAVTASVNGSGDLVLTGVAGTPLTITDNSSPSTLTANIGLTAGTTQPPAQLLGTLNFNTDGSLNTTTSTTQPISINYTLNNGAANMAYTLDMAGTTQFGSDFGVNSLSQDGFSSGRLTNFDIGADGTMTGHYSNNQTRVLGQIALANFANPEGLKAIGDNQYVETFESGAALTGAPGSASLGILQASALEQSNVDLTSELVNMITAQRVYQANTESIKTQDQILQTIVNLR